jgi:hypothetical protein
MLGVLDVIVKGVVPATFSLSEGCDVLDTRRLRVAPVIEIAPDQVALIVVLSLLQVIERLTFAAGE